MMGLFRGKIGKKFLETAWYHVFVKIKRGQSCRVFINEGWHIFSQKLFLRKTETMDI